MALKQNYKKEINEEILKISGLDFLKNKLDNPLIFEESYVRIDELVGNKDKIDLTIHVYDSHECLLIIDTLKYSFIPILEGDNFIKQGYEYLKTLEEYKDAVDILE